MSGADRNVLFRSKGDTCMLGEKRMFKDLTVLVFTELPQGTYAFSSLIKNRDGFEILGTWYSVKGGYGSQA